MIPDVANWTSDDVGAWLRTVGYEQYVKFFAENRMDGQALLALTTDELFRLVKFFNDTFKLRDILKFRDVLAPLQRREKPPETGFPQSQLDTSCFSPARPIIDHTWPPVTPDMPQTTGFDAFVPSEGFNQGEQIENVNPVENSRTEAAYGSGADIVIAAAGGDNNQRQLHNESADIVIWNNGNESSGGSIFDMPVPREPLDTRAEPLTPVKADANNTSRTPEAMPNVVNQAAFTQPSMAEAELGIEAQEISVEERQVLSNGGSRTTAEEETGQMVKNSGDTVAPEKVDINTVAANLGDGQNLRTSSTTASSLPPAGSIAAQAKTGTSMDQSGSASQGHDTSVELSQNAATAKASSMSPIAVSVPSDQSTVDRPKTGANANLSRWSTQSNASSSSATVSPQSAVGVRARLTPLPSAHLSKAHYLYNYPGSSVQLPKLGSTFRGYFSYAESPLEFSIVTEKSFDTTRKLCEIMKRFYEKDPHVLPLAPEMVKPGTACAAKFEGEWYRAIIERVLDEDQVVVRYVDFGNRETLHRRQLMSLRKDRFTDNPPQCIDCRLSGIPQNFPISDAQRDDFFDMVEPMEKMFLIRIEDYARVPYAIHVMDCVLNRPLNDMVQRLLGIEESVPYQPEPLKLNLDPDGKAEEMDDAFWNGVGYSNEDFGILESSSDSD